MNKHQIRASALLCGLLGFASLSQAAVDVSGVVTEISGASAPIALIGGASLVVAVGIKVYKWVRRAL